MNEAYGQKRADDLPVLISFGGIHPDQEDIKEQLRSLKEMGFVGIKLHPDYQGVDFNDIRYKRIVSYATELGFIISVHAGIDIGIPNPIRCTPAMSLEVLCDTSFIVSYMEQEKEAILYRNAYRLLNGITDK